MATLKAHFDGRVIILDEAPPADLVPGSPVTVTVNGASTSDKTDGSVLDQIGRLARPLGFPPDYSAQHEHYVKGTPRK